MNVLKLRDRVKKNREANDRFAKAMRLLNRILSERTSHKHKGPLDKEAGAVALEPQSLGVLE